MNYVIHTAAGEILRTGACPDGEEALQVGEGELLFLGTATFDQRIENGQVVDLPPKPSSFHVFDYQAKTWADPRTLQQLRDAQWSQLKSARDTAEWGGFTWDGSVFDSDPISQSRIQGAAQLATLASMAGQVFAIDWTLANNTVRSLSATEMIGVGEALGVHIQTQMAIGRALRDQLGLASTASAIAAIVWPN